MQETPSMSPHDQLEHAAAQLHCAATLAEQRGLGNPLDPWWAIAGTIRLVAAGLDPMATSAPLPLIDVHQHLTAALVSLDDVSADDAPSDFMFWRAHVVDLEANALALESRTAKANGDS
jgi:hypothetical protein